MHDDDNRLIMKEEPQLAMWAVYTALTLLLVFAAIDYCCTVEDNGGGWYPTVLTRSLGHITPKTEKWRNAVTGSNWSVAAQCNHLVWKFDNKPCFSIFAAR